MDQAIVTIVVKMSSATMSSAIQAKWRCKLSWGKRQAAHKRTVIMRFHVGMCGSYARYDKEDEREENLWRGEH